MTEYKLVKQKVILGKKRNIYKKKGSNKEYVKYKCKMMNVVKYKKMKTKKLPKKRKLSRKTKKRGGYYETNLTKFERFSDHVKAHILLRGITDNPKRIYTWDSLIDPNTEALINLNWHHVNLIRTYKSRQETEGINLKSMHDKLIKINLTHMPKSVAPVSDISQTPSNEEKLIKNIRKFNRDSIIQPTTLPDPQKQEKKFSYKEHIKQGIPALRNPNGPGYIEDNNICTGINSKDKTVPFCKVYDDANKNNRYFPDQKCDYVADRCVLDARATMAFNGFVQNPDAKAVNVRGPTAQEVAHAAAKKHAAEKYAAVRNGGKKRKVNKSVKTKKFK
tara:strand:+ start:853 stop:1851 length:999 start_codon:yes stop_codon:yes gene_type:complete